MQSSNKLGEDRSLMGAIPGIVMPVSVAIVWIVFGAEAAFKWAFMALCIFASFSLAAFLRTRSIGYMATTLFLVAASLMLAVRTGFIPGDHEIAPPFAILLMLSIGFLGFAVWTRQVKWRGRDILELAAQPVDEVVEGYTARPHPAGKAEYTRSEIVDFANFARRKLIAWTFVERDRVVFALVKMGNEYGYLFSPNRGYDDATWVAFDSEGNITVNISAADYLEFKEDFDFDHLCSSLADVFVDFLEMHRKGQDTRILDRLDAMKVGVMS